MGILDLLDGEKEVPINDVEKLIRDLREVQIQIVDFTNEAQIDTEIAEMIGKLKAHDPETLSGQELIEFLVYLSDKTKTKADTTRNHYTDTMMRVVHAKIELLLIYHKSLVKGSVLRQIFSISTVWPIIITITFGLVALVTIHKYDPSLFVDLGIGHNQEVKDSK